MRIALSAHLHTHRLDGSDGLAQLRAKSAAGGDGLAQLRAESAAADVALRAGVRGRWTRGKRLQEGALLAPPRRHLRLLAEQHLAGSHRQL